MDRENWGLPALYAVFGFILGLSFSLLGQNIGGFLLGAVLKNSLLGFLLVGSYFFLLGVAGLVGLHSMDTAPFKQAIRKVSVVNWMASIFGATVGLAISALCKASGMYAVGFLLSAAIFGGFAWVVYRWETDIFNASPNGDEKLKKEVTLSSAAALVIGSVTLCLAWVDVCQCHILSFK